MESPKQDAERAEDWFTQTFGPIIEANRRVIAAYDKGYGASPKEPENWLSPGSISHIEQLGSRTVLHCENAVLLCDWINERVLRIWLRPDRKIPNAEPFSYAVATAHPPDQQPRLQEHEAALRIENGDWSVRVDRASTSLSVEPTTTNNKVLIRQVKPGWTHDGAVRMALEMAPDESCHGTGQRTFELNLRGQHLNFWNTDAGAYVRGFEPINYCVPFYLGAHQHGAYGILWDNSYRASLDLGTQAADMLEFQARGGELRAYLFCGPTLEQVIADYTWLTGRMPLPPGWAIGYHQCRFSYHDEASVLEVAHELRQRKIPCDAIYLDIDYMDGKRVFTWDRRAFPDLKSMADQLHRIGMKLVVILDPGVKVEAGYAAYESGIAEGIFMSYPDGQPAAGVVWPGLCHFPDFSSEKARAWWVQQMQPLLAAGVDGIWNDMNEPLYFGNAKTDDPPDYVQHHKEGLGGDHAEIHNVYGMLMARASREAVQKHYPDRRPFIITRAGYAGTQRYASSWTGDNRATWDNLRQSIAMQINLALSGQSFTGADIGGFAGDTSPELLARWTQAGALLPFFRNHSANDTIRKEPYQFGEEIERICRNAIELRYQLMPYLYTQFARCSTEGLPIIRPIFTHEHENVVIRQIDDAYLLGEHLLVAPVLTEHSRCRLVYLPAGVHWYDFWTQHHYPGGQWICVEAPLDHLPIFVCAGTVLPMQSVEQYAGENQLDALVLRCYPGDGETILYEDEGEGYGYQSGIYRRTRFTLRSQSGLSWQSEGKYTPEYTWAFERLTQNKFEPFQP